MIKSLSLFSPFVAALALSATSTFADPTVITNDGTTTPAINPPNVGAFFGYNGSEYDSGNGFTDSAAPGETFLTPTGSSLNLQSITLQESNGSAFDATNQTFSLTIFSISGTTLMSLGTENVVFNGTAPGDGGYFTMDVSSLALTLSANTEYAFSLSTNATDGLYPNYLGLVSSAYGDTTTGQDSYADGVAIEYANPLAAGGTEALVTPLVNGDTYDRAFSVQFADVPEPSTWAMMFGGIAVLLGISRLRRLSS